ncbi:hypothetical protein LguiA_029529 [Lonicera macranthoides]
MSQAAIREAKATSRLTKTSTAPSIYMIDNVATTYASLMRDVHSTPDVSHVWEGWKVTIYPHNPQKIKFWHAPFFAGYLVTSQQWQSRFRQFSFLHTCVCALFSAFCLYVVANQGQNSLHLMVKHVSASFALAAMFQLSLLLFFSL